MDPVSLQAAHRRRCEHKARISRGKAFCWRSAERARGLRGGGDAGLFQPKVKGTVWARQGSERFYSSAAVFESAAFQQRGWRKRSAPSHLRALCCRWLFALVGVVAHFLGTNVDLALYIRAGGRGGRTRRARFLRNGSGFVGPWLADGPKNSSDVFIVFFFLFVTEAILRSPQRHRSRSWNPVCRVNREAENNTGGGREGKFPPCFFFLFSSFSPPMASPVCPPLLVLYLWPKCLGIKSYYFLVNKPVSGRNYTQLGVRSFSEGGPGAFYLKCFLFLLL